MMRKTHASNVFIQFILQWLSNVRKWKEPKMSGKEMEEEMKSFLRGRKDKASSSI